MKTNDLTPQQQFILDQRKKRRGGPPLHTVRFIGKELNISGAAVHQQERAALAKLCLRKRNNQKISMQRLRVLRRAQGDKAVEVWLDPQAQARVDTLRQPGESISDVIERALHALENVC